MEGRLSLAKEDLCREASIQKLHPYLDIISIRHFVYTVAIKYGIVTSPITIRHCFTNEVGGKTINTALSLSGFATMTLDTVRVVRSVARYGRLGYLHLLGGHVPHFHCSCKGVPQ